MNEWEERGFVVKRQEKLFGFFSIDPALLNEGHTCSGLVTSPTLFEIFSLIVREDPLMMLKQLFTISTSVRSSDSRKINGEF